jgi:hypothetical protein
MGDPAPSACRSRARKRLLAAASLRLAPLGDLAASCSGLAAVWVARPAPAEQARPTGYAYATLTYIGEICGLARIASPRT